jgi:hypothetical protein
MASDELNTRVVDVYAAVRGLVALWREELKPEGGILDEVKRAQIVAEGSLDGLVTAMGLEVPEDGT